MKVTTHPPGNRNGLNSCKCYFKMKWLSTLTAVPLGLGLNPGEGMDVCKCTVPSQHGGTLNSRRATSPFVWLVAEEERWETPDHL
ncbi:uncharacterized protein TNCV_2795691 [Trichonephila clavipes]|nr:uncharacterized protein TNCV_2795691 [Trichonephila clavipes]